MEGATGSVRFNLRDFGITVEQNNIIGNILEEWLDKWMTSKGIVHMRSHSKFFYLLNISELSILKNVTANDLETSYILFLSQLCNIQRTL